MRIELEEEVCEVNEDEDNRSTATELEQVRCFKAAIDPAVQPFMLSETSGLRERVGEVKFVVDAYKCCRDDQGDDGDRHQGRVQLGCHGLKLLRPEPESTHCEERQSQ